MKRLSAFLLALVTILGICMTTGCGKSTESTAETSRQTAAENNHPAETTASAAESITSTTASDLPGDNTQTSSHTESSDAAETDDILENWNGQTKLPGYENVDFRGAEFLIAGYEGASDGFDTVREVYATESDGIAVAVRQRNDYIQRLYHCVISWKGSTDPAGLVSAEVTSGKQTIDLYCAKYATGNSATYMPNYNLHSLGIDITQPWWDQNYVNTYNIKNSAGQDCLYSIVGDFCFATNSLTHALIFNKNVYATAVEGKLNMDIYELVRTGKWTMDRLADMAKSAATEVSGNDTLSYHEGDILGWLTTGHGTHGLQAASNLPLMETVNGRFEYSLSKNAAQWVGIVDKAQEMWSLPAHEVVSYSQGVAALISGQTLFYSDIISKLEESAIVEAGVALGLAPYPKYSETQERYMHYVDNHLPVYMVPNSITALDEMGDFFTVYAAHSTAIVRPAWIDAYAYDYCGDSESGEMLNDYILPNRSFDPGYLVFTGLEGDISAQISSTKNNVVAIIEKRSKDYTGANNKIDEWIALVDDNLS